MPSSVSFSRASLMELPVHKRDHLRVPQNSILRPSILRPGLTLPHNIGQFVSRLTLGALLCCFLAAHAQQPASSAPPDLAPSSEAPLAASAATADAQSPSPATLDPSATPESLLIGPGDLLRITVLRESELDQRVRVLDSGEITLALVGNLPVQGLTSAQAAARIADQYRGGKFLLHPEVSVLVDEYGTETVTILGQVAHPGTVHLAAPRSLIDVLSLAGGLTEVADRH